MSVSTHGENVCASARIGASVGDAEGSAVGKAVGALIGTADPLLTVAPVLVNPTLPPRRRMDPRPVGAGDQRLG
jgi:hypothetical protein